MLQEETLILDRPKRISRFQTGVPKNLGRYHLDGLLGTGGMAQVYSGEYRGIHGFKKSVAIKVAKPQPLESALLRREARLLAQIQHPNVIQILDAGEESGHAYYAMDWIDGWNLKQLLSKYGAFPPLVCIEIALQVCDALSDLHNRTLQGVPCSIIHGDVKPANIMINGNGWTQLLDFGIASLHDPTIRPPSYGTAAYIAPEQLGMNQPDCRTDLFALGVVLYEMATGTKLFGGKDVSDLVRERIDLDRHIDRGKMTQDIGKCHPALADVIHCCIQHSMDNRFASADSLRAALTGAKRRVSRGENLKGWIGFL